MSSEQAPARRAGGERPRMMFGRRAGSADLTWIESEAAIMSSEQAPARRAGGERPRMMFGRRAVGDRLFVHLAEAAIISRFEVVA
jgi:hypothetical protein